MGAQELAHALTGKKPEETKTVSTGRQRRHVAAYEERDCQVRLTAAMALGRLEGQAAPYVELIASALGDIDEEVRRVVAEVLGGLGPDALRFKSELEQLCTDDDCEVQLAARDALRRLQVFESISFASRAESN